MSDYVSFDEQFEQERSAGRSEGESAASRRAASQRRSSESAARSRSSAVRTVRTAESGLSAGPSISKVQARKMVVVSGLLLVVIAIYRDRKTETANDTFHRLWSVGIVVLLLSILADFAPTIAGPFAALTVLGWLARDGTGVIDAALGTGGASAGAGGSSVKPVASGTPTTGAAVKTTLPNG